MKFKKGDRVKATAKYLMKTGYVRLKGKIGVVYRVSTAFTEVDFKIGDGDTARYAASTKGHYWRHVD